MHQLKIKSWKTILKKIISAIITAPNFVQLLVVDPAPTTASLHWIRSHNCPCVAPTASCSAAFRALVRTHAPCPPQALARQLALLHRRCPRQHRRQPARPRPARRPRLRLPARPLRRSLCAAARAAPAPRWQVPPAAAAPSLILILPSKRTQTLLAPAAGRVGRPQMPNLALWASVGGG